MDQTQVKLVIEAALLAAGRPLSLEKIASLFTAKASGLDKETLQGALDELASDYKDRGLELKEVSSGYRIQIKSSMTDWLTPLWEERAPRYTRALLETLALIAYRQPITRGEIEDVRGVAVSTNITRTLLERNWIRVVGHREVPGRPAMFGTTRDFLDYFGLKKLEDLPTLAEIKEGVPKENPQSDLIEALSSLEGQVLVHSERSQALEAGHPLDAGDALETHETGYAREAGYAEDVGREAGLVIAHAAVSVEEAEESTAFGDDFSAPGQRMQTVGVEGERIPQDHSRAHASYEEPTEDDEDAHDEDDADEDDDEDLVEDDGEGEESEEKIEDSSDDDDDFEDDDADRDYVDDADEAGARSEGDDSVSAAQRDDDCPDVLIGELSTEAEPAKPTGAATDFSADAPSAPEDADERDSADDDTVVQLIRSESH